LVANVSQIQCFVVWLPRAVPERRIELAKIGRMMAEIYYLEVLGKLLEAKERGQAWYTQDLARPSMYIRIADEVTENRFLPVP